MGLCASSGNGPVRLLLCGPAGVGKSTLFRQVKLLRTSGFSDEELAVGSVAIRTAVKAALKFLLANPEVQALLDRDLVATSLETIDKITDVEANPGALLHIANQVWGQRDIQDALSSYLTRDSAEKDSACDEVANNEWLEFWLDEAERILGPNYEPTPADMLKLRRATDGAQEIAFEVDDVPVVLIDVGGQASQRKFWDLEIEKGVGGMIFMVALSDYDKKEDGENKLRAAFALLNETLRSNDGALSKVPVCLMMNKVDLFQKKIKRKPKFYRYIKQCPKKHTSVDDILEWLECELIEGDSIVKAAHAKLEAFPTCAADTQMAEKMVRKTFNAILSQAVADFTG